MKTVKGLNKIDSRGRPLILAAGFFDGVHLGHRLLIKEAIRERNKEGGEAWVLTFDAHPSEALRPKEAPPLITPLRHKLKLLESLGVDGCVVVPFSFSFSRLEPERFIERLKKSAHSLRALAVGENWTFGYRKQGTAWSLKRMALRHGFRVRLVPPLSWKGSPISSTRIRRHIQLGRLDSASQMLGRPMSIFGQVEKGDGRGTAMGFPTANINLSNEALPPDGVYAAKADISGCLYDGILNLGVRPTFKTDGAAKRVLELHIFDERLSLYGTEIEVFFLKKLRSEKRFASMEGLRRRQEKDIAASRAWLAGLSTKNRNMRLPSLLF